MATDLTPAMTRALAVITRRGTVYGYDGSGITFATAAALHRRGLVDLATETNIQRYTPRGHYHRGRVRLQRDWTARRPAEGAHR